MRKTKDSEITVVPINRIILVGNGFDLAHGMRTSYTDFIIWYFNKIWLEARNSQTINPQVPYEIIYKNKLLNFSFDISLSGKSSPLDNPYGFTLDDIKQHVNFISNNSQRGQINLSFNSDIFKSIVGDLLERNWVDIENIYYDFLRKRLKEHNLHLDLKPSHLQNSLKEINSQFDILKSELENYLTTISPTSKNHQTDDYLYEPPIPSNLENSDQLELGNVLLLNFNYTPTTDMYKKPDTDIIHIHGQLNDPNNPIIFGYGDERDETYDILEKANIPEVFTHIKSFDYFKTNNYSRLLAFLESPYDVYVMGHSCGLSDRTLLSTIFENPNCRFIKLFYYKNEENYRNTTYELSRHFKDKAEMRKKVLDFTRCEAMPQNV